MRRKSFGAQLRWTIATVFYAWTIMLVRREAGLEMRGRMVALARDLADDDR